jgi:lipoprotein NlpD
VQALRIAGALVLVLLFGACTSPVRRAPVEDRSSIRPLAAAASSAEPVKPPPPGIENAGKPGYYTVRPGDTMIRVGLETGQNWRDIAKWNGLTNPDMIEVGQVLRVVPPAADPSVATAKPIAVPKIEARPLAIATSGSGPTTGTLVSGSSASSAPLVPPPLPQREGDDDLAWSWPAAGPVISSFEDGRSKGVAIGGKTGDPVLAAADGRVVYAGSGLRGYGNLVIIKHNGTYLTAYAHNQVLFVKEDQAIKRGQKIAEMGSSDAERVQLHFEIRKLGKPVDPVKMLPSR